jgi:hypothetical protein
VFTYHCKNANTYIGVHRCSVILVNQTTTKILKVGSRHTVYLEKAFVEDSAFPFKPDELLSVRIDKNKLVIEKG